MDNNTPLFDDNLSGHGLLRFSVTSPQFSLRSIGSVMKTITHENEYLFVWFSAGMI